MDNGYINHRIYSIEGAQSPHPDIKQLCYTPLYDEDQQMAVHFTLHHTQCIQERCIVFRTS